MNNLLISCFHLAHQKHGLLVYFFCTLGQNKSRKGKIQAKYQVQTLVGAPCIRKTLQKWETRHQLHSGMHQPSPSQGKFTEDNNINEQLSASLLFLGSCIFQTSIPSTILACIHIDKKTILMRFVVSIKLGAKE